MHPEWARSLRDQCVSVGVPFFFKQWGGRNKKAAGRAYRGRLWDDLPADVRGQLEKAMNEATVYSNKIAATENAEGLDEIKKSGKTEIIVPTAAEMAAMRKAMEPLYQDMASRVGKQLIDDVRKTAQGVTN